VKFVSVRILKMRNFTPAPDFGTHLRKQPSEKIGSMGGAKRSTERLFEVVRKITAGERLDGTRLC
jgi:hypothetical protein